MKKADNGGMERRYEDAENGVLPQDLWESIKEKQWWHRIQLLP